MHWAHRRACLRCYSANLSFPPEVCQIWWKGIRGLQWKNLLVQIFKLVESGPSPDVIVIHGGGNDVGKQLELLLMFKNDFHLLQKHFPRARLIFSEIVPRLIWLSAGKQRNLEKIRRRINHAMEKFMPKLGGFSFRHTELEGGFPGLYRQDGIHLSDVGLDIFNSDIQTMIEKAAVLG